MDPGFEHQQTAQLPIAILLDHVDARAGDRLLDRVDLLVGRKLEYVWLGHAVVLGFSGGCQVLIEAVAHLDARMREIRDIMAGRWSPPR